MVTGPNGQSAVTVKTSTGQTLTVLNSQNAQATQTYSSQQALSVVSLLVTGLATGAAMYFIYLGFRKGSDDVDHFLALSMLALIILWADKSQMIQTMAALGQASITKLSQIAGGN